MPGPAFVYGMTRADRSAPVMEGVLRMPVQSNPPAGATGRHDRPEGAANHAFEASRWGAGATGRRDRPEGSPG